MVENSAQKGRKGGKLQEISWILYHCRKFGEGIVQVKNEDGKILQKKFNINRLKVYRKRAECDATQNEANILACLEFFFIVLVIFIGNWTFFCLCYP